jgi:lambda family phage portal protein
MRIETLAGLYTAAGHILPEVPRMSRARMSGFEGASTGRRLANWKPSDAAVDALLSAEGDTLRARARDAARKNPYAGNAAESFVANAIGSGIKPESLHPDKAIKEKIQKLWKVSVDELDADGLTDFYGQQAMTARTQFISGECLGRLRNRRPGDGLAVPLQVQLINPEHLPLTKNELAPNGNKIRWGIEFNGIGQRVGYHLYRENPGLGAHAFSANPFEMVRVPADQMVHVYRPLSVGQMRGCSWLAPVLVPLYETDKFMDATLFRQQLANMFVGWQRSINQDDPIIASTSTDPEGNAMPEGVGTARIEGGTFWDLDPNETMEFNKPPDPAATYADFVKVTLHMIAAGIGITYEQLTGDLEGVTYSSIRQGVLEFRRRCEQFQFQVMAFQFCRPIWRRWIEQAVFAGALPLPRSQEEWNDLYAVEWRTPRWSWVDPLKDVLAAKEEVRCGFSSRSAKIHESGYDPEQVDRENAEDHARAEKAGLVYDSDPSQTAGSGAAQSLALAEAAPSGGSK